MANSQEIEILESLRSTMNNLHDVWDDLGLDFEEKTQRGGKLTQYLKVRNLKHFIIVFSFYYSIISQFIL